MIEKKYGQIAETTKEAREIGSAYSQAKANLLVFAVIQWDNPLATKGDKGAEMRRKYMDAQSQEVQEMYRRTRTIGVPWYEVAYTSHDFHRLPLTMQNEMKDNLGRFKATPSAIKILEYSIKNGLARIIACHNDYVQDLYKGWIATLVIDKKTGKERGNFGYAYEWTKHGTANYTTSKCDGGKEQNKASFSLYRSEDRPKTGGGFYQRGTTDGVSTANGEKK